MNLPKFDLQGFLFVSLGSIAPEYFDTVAYGNLWEGHCHRMAGPGHAPFWEAPGYFDPVLERFPAGRRNRPGGDSHAVSFP